MIEKATNDPLLVNNYGQDIEFRIAPDGKNWPQEEWSKLPTGGQTPVAAPPQACTLEIRITLKQPIERPLAAIEVTRSLQVKCKQQGELTRLKRPTRKSGSTKRASRTERPSGPSDSPRAAS